MLQSTIVLVNHPLHKSRNLPAAVPRSASASPPRTNINGLRGGDRCRLANGVSIDLNVSSLILTVGKHSRRLLHEFPGQTSPTSKERVNR